MIDGLQGSMEQFIEKRLEALLISKEYQVFADIIYRDLEEKLLDATKTLDGEARNFLIEDIRSNIFEQVFFQTKQAYKQGFSDSFSVLVDLLVNKKP